ncbi:hypothetical protein GQ54DRAFT_299727 [Martensiomyces pterosporus]|nr:hypothetical protein GQ54DRAFT_299727 [Martensiomyces pterosporus]
MAHLLLCGTAHMRVGGTAVLFPHGHYFSSRTPCRGIQNFAISCQQAAGDTEAHAFCFFWKDSSCQPTSLPHIG